MQEYSKKLRPPLDVWKESLLKVKFNICRLDCERFWKSAPGKTHASNKSEMPVSGDVGILTGFEREFYLRQTYGKGKIGWMKRRRFESDFKRHRRKYPPLIKIESLQIDNLNPAAPGNSLDKTLIPGYFRELKTPDGAYFINLFGAPVEPVTPLLQEIVNELKRLTDSLDPSGEKRERLTLYLQDTKWLGEIAQFLRKIYAYAEQNRFAHLKSGHLVAFMCGARIFAEDLLAELREMGFAAVSVQSPLPLYTLVDTFAKRAGDILNDLLIDLVMPLAEGAGWKVSVEKGRTVFDEPETIERGFFSSVVDFFLRLLGRDKDKETKPASNIPDSKKDAPVNIPSQPRVQVIESGLFSDLAGMLGKFAEELHGDLAPEENEKGEVTDYHAMFDQMDIPAAERKIELSTHILRGRMPGVDPLDPHYKDQIIVQSTYWLYDRINDLLAPYHIGSEGIPIDDARRFSDAVRDLFLTPRHELNEALQYGNFPQFRINIRRLFSSNTQHDKYFGIIKQVSDQLNKARDYLLSEEKKNASHKNSKS
ncbi:MAG: hypothetical protein HPY53_08910 [Brevinematales bacterium]|nr:hypothetical protein [Brevinematales bacterium]